MKKQKELRFKVTENTLLQEFLLNQKTDYNLKKIKAFLKYKAVTVNGVKTSKYNYELKKGDEVIIHLDQKYTKELPFDLIYEDEDFIVINKPSGLLSVSTDDKVEKNVFKLVREYYWKKNPKGKIYVVHRLDKDTSGVLILAKNEILKNKLQDKWNELVTRRSYVAVVEGTNMKSGGTLTSYLMETKDGKVYSTNDTEQGKLAVTKYKVKKETKPYTLLAVNIETGRKNQIRVHLSELGYPIIGDKKYGSKENPIKRLGLHADVIEFIHPINKKKYKFEAVVPIKFTSLLRKGKK